MSGEPLSLHSHSPEETRAFGEILGRLCSGGEILLLQGDLGAGKTCFTQGLGVGLGIPANDPVTSPTFVLHCQYFGRLTLNHIDAYRLQDAEDVCGLGFDEAFNDPDAVSAVEWPLYLDSILPQAGLHVHLSMVSENTRNLTFAALDQTHASFLRRFTDQMDVPSPVFNND